MTLLGGYMWGDGPFPDEPPRYVRFTTADEWMKDTLCEKLLADGYKSFDVKRTAGEWTITFAALVAVDTETGAVTVFPPTETKEDAV